MTRTGFFLLRLFWVKLQPPVAYPPMSFPFSRPSHCLSDGPSIRADQSVPAPHIRPSTPPSTYRRRAKQCFLPNQPDPHATIDRNAEPSPLPHSVHPERLFLPSVKRSPTMALPNPPDNPLHPIFRRLPQFVGFPFHLEPSSPPFSVREQERSFGIRAQKLPVSEATLRLP